LFLDFGQRFVDNCTCRMCGMVYGHGIAADDAAHARWCKSVRASQAGSVAFAGWTAMRQLGTLHLPFGKAKDAVTRDIRSLLLGATNDALSGNTSESQAVAAAPAPSAADSTRVTPTELVDGLTSVTLECAATLDSPVEATGTGAEESCKAPFFTAQPEHASPRACREHTSGDPGTCIATGALAVRRSREGAGSTFHIVAFGAADPSYDTKACELRLLLDAELGEQSCPVRRRRCTVAKDANSTSTVSPAAAADTSLSPFADVDYFIALTGGHVAGILVTERVENAFRIRLCPTAVASPPEHSTSRREGCAALIADPTFVHASGDSLLLDVPFSTPRALSDVLDLSTSVKVTLGVAQVRFEVCLAANRRGSCSHTSYFFLLSCRCGYIKNTVGTALPVHFWMRRDSTPSLRTWCPCMSSRSVRPLLLALASRPLTQAGRTSLCT
jgi:hypothetical protein